MITTGPVTLVVTHLTRMNNGNICLAGVNVADGHHVRPVLGRGIPRAFLDRPGGRIALGSLLSFAQMKPHPEPPEVEDHLFDEADCSVIGTVTSSELRGYLEPRAVTSLRDIFGPELQRQGRTMALPPGVGLASLGILRDAVALEPEIDSYGKVRMLLEDRSGGGSVPVTDIRLFDEANLPDRSAVRLMANRMRGQRPLLSIGVGRA